MPYEEYPEAEKFDTATCLSLYDKIPDWRLGKLDELANNAGMDSEILKNAIEIASEDPKKIKRLGELLTVLAKSTKYGDVVEKEEIPEKIKELIKLVAD